MLKTSQDDSMELMDGWTKKKKNKSTKKKWKRKIKSPSFLFFISASDNARHLQRGDGHVKKK